MKRMKLLISALVAMAPGFAYAEPVSIIIAVVQIAVVAGNVALAVAAIAVMAGVSISQRNRLKRKAAEARARFVASLSDRAVTGVSITPPYRVIYGRAETGGDLVAILTSDQLIRKKLGLIVTKHDAYKHLVIVWSHRECWRINGLKIDGIPLGDPDADGWIQNPYWRRANPETLQTKRVAGNLRSTDVPSGATVTSVQLAAGAEASNSGLVPGSGSNSWSQSGATVNLPNTVVVAGVSLTPSAADVWEINYLAQETDNFSAVHVSHHTGSGSQPADAFLMDRVPELWTAAHQLRGRCYSVVTIDLTRPQFQGGPPNITADISGALVYDPRTDMTGWSENPALIHADWLKSEMGYSVPDSAIDWSTVTAAANACDEPVQFNVGDEVVTAPRYTCNGVITSDQDKESVRLDLCESMAGWSHPEGQWRVLAGVWTPPVMDLTDDDLDGSIDILQTGEPSSDLYNGMRGQYIPAGSGTPADFTPYSNSTFVAADGRRLWRSNDLPFANSNARSQNLARIAVEQSRNGLVIFYPAKLKAWPLQVGDRVRVTSADYGFSLKLFRVNEWSFGLRSPVGLMLQEDSPETWDESDAVLPDPTPNTNLPDPWVVPPIEIVSAESGTSALMMQSDGTIQSRIHLTWTLTEAPYMDGGFIEIRWRAVLSDAWNYLNVEPTDTEAYLTNVQDGAVVHVQVTVVNSLKARSPIANTQVLVLGKTEPPAAITGLAATRVLGALILTRDEAADLDWANTVYEYSANGGASWVAFNVNATRRGATWTAPVVGALKIRARDIDTSGNAGPITTPIDVTIAPDALGGVSSTLGIKINVGDFAGTTNYSECYIHGRDGSGAAADVDGTIQLNGASVTVPKGLLVTGQGPVSAFIIWDKSGTGFSTTIPSMAPWVMARKSAGQWQYDNNSGWVDFTPTADHYVIGLIQSGGVDTGNPGAPPGILSATMLSAAWVPDSIAGLADAATAAAAAAQTAANNAQTSANSALGTLNAMRSNGILDASEKPALIRQWQALDGEKAGIIAQAGVYGITAELASYNASLAALNSYLNSLSPAWNDTTQDTPITPATDQGAWLGFYNTRQALLNKIADAAGKVANWTGVANRPKTYRVGAYGLSATGIPMGSDLLDADTNAGLVSGGAMYRVVKIHRTTKVVTDLGAYNPLSGAGGALAQCNAMADALNSIDASHICVVFTYDEPATNRRLGNLPAAMYRNGASRNVWGSDAFQFRAAYILVGIGGCGEGNGHENYSGAVSSDPNAWCETTFQLTATGAFQASGASRGATTLLDYGYVGSLDATTNKTYEQDADPAVTPGGVVDGAYWRVLTGVNANRWYQRAGGVWRPTVAPSTINTIEIADGAVMDVFNVKIAGPINVMSEALLQRVNIPTFSVDTTVIVTVSLAYDLTPGGSPAIRRCWGQTFFAGTLPGVNLPRNTAPNESLNQFEVSQSFTGTFQGFAGTTGYYVDVFGAGQGGLASAYARNIEITIQARKR